MFLETQEDLSLLPGSQSHMLSSSGIFLDSCWEWFTSVVLEAASLRKPSHLGEIPTPSAGAHPALQCLQRTSQDPASDLASSPKNDLGSPDSGSPD